MSNHLAIATVTATLQRMLQSAVGVDMEGATVTTVRPDSNGGGTPETGLNLYLYQVSPNLAGRNMDLPTRRSDGTTVMRPRVAFDLHYLLTFYGEESSLVPQRVLGSVARTLHAQPILSRESIRTTVDEHEYLSDSNLADEVELVRFTPISLSLEELSKLWSVFFQVPYRLSVAYQASVVQIEEEETISVAKPVTEPVIEVQPSITEPVEAASPDELEDLEMWLEADAGVTYDEEGEVSDWADQSGNGYDAAQSKADNMPTFVPHTIGRKPVIRFEGNDYLAIRGFHYDIPGAVDQITICMLFRSTSSEKQILMSFDRSEYWRLSLREAESRYVGWDTADETGTVHNQETEGSYNDGRWHFLCVWFEAGASPDKGIRIDGEGIASDDAHGGGNIGTGETRYGFIGVGSEAGRFNGRRAPYYYFQGDIAEVAVYNRALEGSELDQLEEYIKEKYA